MIGGSHKNYLTVRWIALQKVWTPMDPTIALVMTIAKVRNVILDMRL